MKQSLGIGILTAFLSVALYSVAHADISGGLKLTSHYAWQGGSESAEEPALQGSVYYNLDACYAGFWASSADYPGGIEIDYETGCGGSLSESVGYSIDLIWLTYPGDTSENLVEARFKLSADLGMASVWARLGLPKWSDNTGATNTSGHNRPQVGINVPLGDGPSSISATYGMDNKRKNCDDYDWYHVSVNTSLSGFGLSMFYSDRSDRDPTCSDPEAPGKPQDGIFGVSLSRSF